MTELQAKRRPDDPYCPSSYPVRETGALISIAQKLGFQTKTQYEGAVRKLMIDDSEALAFIRGLFDTLAQ
jgi:hypothetical protein